MAPTLRRAELSDRIIEAVLFDFDGTLTSPGGLDFEEIRGAIGCPPSASILTYIDSLEDRSARREAERVLAAYERAAADASTPNDGAEELIEYLRATGVPIAIQTRNTMDAVRRALENFSTVDESAFSLIIARDSDVPPKPDPAGIRIAAGQMSVAPDRVLVVGDYLYEIEAACAVGCVSVLLESEVAVHSEANMRRAGEIAAYRTSKLADIKSILRLHRPLPQGKIPNDLLAVMIRRTDDPSVVVGPGPGEDVAVVRAEAEGLLALKSDPITFATSRPGYYTVTINANDIATAGAVPRWMTVTILLPPKTVPAVARQLVEDLRSVAAEAKLELVGGHTEITDAVVRPVVSGTVVGVVDREALLRKDAVRAGDVIVMTKTAGLEGTAILADEASAALREAGLSRETIEEARQFTSRLSIVPEARVAAGVSGVRCLHDVTEGGIATAIEEVALATGHELTVDLDRIRIDRATTAICGALSLNPLGLIGSGSLLACVSPDAEEELLSALEGAGVPAATIGIVGAKREHYHAGANSPRIRACRGDTAVDWPRFSTDELARHLEG